MKPSLAGAQATLVAVVVADMDPVTTVSTVTVLSSSQLQLTQGQVSEDPEEQNVNVRTFERINLSYAMTSS